MRIRWFLVFLNLTFFIAARSFAQQSEEIKSTGPILVPILKAGKTPRKKKASPDANSTSSAKSPTATSTTPPEVPPPAVAPNERVSETVDARSSLEDGEELVESISKGNKAVQRMQSGAACDTCDLNFEHYAGTGRDQELNRFNTKESHQEGELLIPTKDLNSSLTTRNSMCGSRTSYDVCIYEGDATPGILKLTELRGKSQREWNFYLENKARQDLGFSISDVTENKSKESYFMVFPRKFLPSIKVIGNKQVVTLANGETVTYEIPSEKIIGGVFSNDKNYSGQGVMIRAEQTGTDARFAKGNSDVSITKAGKSCKVSKKLLWPDQSRTSALHFKFANDEDFDLFLKQKCGFGI
jgi:hypothetical protein